MNEMDNIIEEMNGPARRTHKGSALRGWLFRVNQKRKLVNFAKHCFYEYLNSGRDFDEIVDEWMKDHPTCF